MNWWIWIALFVPLALPPFSLVFDRVFGTPARALWVFPGLPLAAIFSGALIYAIADGDELAELVLWGVVMGIAGTITLDIVRLIGVRYNAFPLDMPEMFGMIALGRAPALQRNMMREMVAATAVLPAGQREATLRPRLRALARMPSGRRAGAIAGMMAGLATLPEGDRQGMLETQMAVMARLPSEERRALMSSMDAAMGGGGALMYAQPRGIPRLPMATFRHFAARAMPRSQAQAGVSKGTVLCAGYCWHLVIGITFGIAYTLLVGAGSWPLAIAWGVVIWAAMMVLMPPMMPMVRFPRWFVIVPLVAHIAMVIPFALIGLGLVTDAADAHSFLEAVR